MKVLIVDDTPLCLHAIAEILRREGFEVLCANHGEEALGMLSSQPVDLVLLDVMMPGIDGIGVLKLLRGREEWRGLPVVLLTDAADQAHVEAAARIGVQGYLLKSHFSVAELLNRVRKYLPEAQQMAAAAAPDGAVGRVCPLSTAESQSTAMPVASHEAPRSSVPKDRLTILARIRRELELKSVPPVLQHVIALTNSSRSTLEEVVDAIRQDQALAVKVMKLANSSLYNAGKRTPSLSEALQRVGMAGVRNAVAAIMAIEHFSETAASGLVPQRIWEHSLATAMLAQSLAPRTGLDNGDELFLAGLLHDIGRITLSATYPEAYQEAMALATERGIDLVQAEQEIFGLNHAKVSEEVLSHLRMPQSVAHIVGAHAQPVERLVHESKGARDVLVICLADRIAHAMLIGDSGNAILQVFRDVSAALGVAPQTIAAVAYDTFERCTELEVFYESRNSGSFRRPLTEDISRAAGGDCRVIVFDQDAPNDALSLFCERLHWTDNNQPEIAVLVGDTAEMLDMRLAELQTWERDRTPPQAILAVVPAGTEVRPPEPLADRPRMVLPLPARFTAIANALRELRTRFQNT